LLVEVGDARQRPALTWEEARIIFAELFREIVETIGQYCHGNAYKFFREFLQEAEKYFCHNQPLDNLKSAALVSEAEPQEATIEDDIEPLLVTAEDIKAVMFSYYATREGNEEVTLWRKLVEQIFEIIKQPTAAQVFQEKFLSERSIPEEWPHFLQALEKMGKIVSSSHKKTDPARHSLMATHCYFEKAQEESSMPIGQLQLLIEVVAVLLHDVGKIFGPKFVAHSQFSWLIASGILNEISPYIRHLQAQLDIKDQTWTSEKIEQWFAFLISYHDVCGLVSSGKIEIERLFDLVDKYQITPEMWQALGRVQEADMAAIEGMSDKWKIENRQIYHLITHHIRESQAGYTNETK